MSIRPTIYAAISRPISGAIVRGGGTDPDVLAFAVESGATDLEGLDNLVKYLKGESLYDNFVIYPMKSAQNAGSGSTVYSLGGLTTNDVALSGGFSWASTGVDFDGVDATGLITDFLPGGDLTSFARYIPSDTTPSSLEAIFGQWDTGAMASFLLVHRQTGSFNGNAYEVQRSADGTNGGDIEFYDSPANSITAGDNLLVSQYTEGAGRSLWRNKILQSLSLVFGSAQTSRFNAATPISIASRSPGSPISFADIEGVAFALSTDIMTTTQREAVTDLINAL